MEPTDNQLNEECEKRHFTIRGYALGERPRLDYDDFWPLPSREQLPPMPVRKHRYWECEDPRLRAVLRAVQTQEAPDDLSLFLPPQDIVPHSGPNNSQENVGNGIVPVVSQGEGAPSMQHSPHREENVAAPDVLQGQGEPSVQHSPGHNISEENVVMEDIVPVVSQGQGELQHSGASPQHNISEENVVMDDIVPQEQGELSMQNSGGSPQPNVSEENEVMDEGEPGSMQHEDNVMDVAMPPCDGGQNVGPVNEDLGRQAGPLFDFDLNLVPTDTAPPQDEIGSSSAVPTAEPHESTPALVESSRYQRFLEAGGTSAPIIMSSIDGNHQSAASSSSRNYCNSEELMGQLQSPTPQQESGIRSYWHNQHAQPPISPMPMPMPMPMPPQMRNSQGFVLTRNVPSERLERGVRHHPQSTWPTGAEASFGRHFDANRMFNPSRGMDYFSVTPPASIRLSRDQLYHTPVWPPSVPLAPAFYTLVPAPADPIRTHNPVGLSVPMVSRVNTVASASLPRYIPQVNTAVSSAAPSVVLPDLNRIERRFQENGIWLRGESERQARPSAFHQRMSNPNRFNRSFRPYVPPVVSAAPSVVLPHLNRTGTQLEENGIAGESSRSRTATAPEYCVTNRYAWDFTDTTNPSVMRSYRDMEPMVLSMHARHNDNPTTETPGPSNRNDSDTTERPGSSNKRKRS